MQTDSFDSGDDLIRRMLPPKPKSFTEFLNASGYTGSRTRRAKFSSKISSWLRKVADNLDHRADPRDNYDDHVSFDQCP